MIGVVSDVVSVTRPDTPFSRVDWKVVKLSSGQILHVFTSLFHRLGTIVSHRPILAPVLPRQLTCFPALVRQKLFGLKRMDCPSFLSLRCVDTFTRKASDLELACDEGPGADIPALAAKNPEAFAAAYSWSRPTFRPRRDEFLGVPFNSVQYLVMPVV